MKKVSWILAAFVLFFAAHSHPAAAATWQPTYEYTNQWGLGLIHADKAFQAGYTGKGVLIANLDVGIDLTHPKFFGQKITGWNYVTNSSDYPDMLDDNMGHGTMVAGILVAKQFGDPGDTAHRGVYGLAYDSSLFVGKVFPVCSAEVQTNAINGANERKAQIINFEVWSPKSNIRTAVPSEIAVSMAGQIAAFQTAVGQNRLITVPAGNDGLDSPDIEAGLPYLYKDLRKSWLAVVAVNRDKSVAAYSNRAGVMARWSIAAPGGDTDALADSTVDGRLRVLQMPTGANPYTGYVDTAGGTSAAGPHVAGAAALVMQAHPDYTAQMVAQTLFTTADWSFTGYSSAVYGWGLLDVGTAIKGPKYLRRDMLLDADVDPNTGKAVNPKAQVIAEVPALSNPSFDNDMTGDGGLLKGGAGSLALTGQNVYTGDTDIVAGTLYVNGSLSGSQINLTGSGTLGGQGSITGSFTVNSGARLAPGYELAPLTVNGAVTQAAGSYFSPWLGGANYSSSLQAQGAGGRYVNEGAILEPWLWSGYGPKTGDGYGIVTAAGGVSGTYASINLPAGMPQGLGFDVMYGANQIRLYATPADYRAVGTLGWNWNRNQAPVAEAWQAWRPSTAAAMSAEQAPLYTLLFPLDSAGLKEAAWQMSGQLLADSQAGALDLLRSHNRGLTDFLRESSPGEGACQVAQAAQFSRVEDGELPGRRMNASGTLAQCDLIVRSNWRFGAGAGSWRGTVTSPAGSGSSSLEQVSGHIFAQRHLRDYYLEGHLGGGWTGENHNRQLGSAAASGSGGGGHWFGRLAVGREGKRGNGTSNLYLAVLGESVNRGPFAESGDALLTVTSDGGKSGRTAAELAYSRKFAVTTATGFARTQAFKVGLLHEFSTTGNELPLVWRGLQLATASQEQGADAVQAGVGLGWRTKRGWSLDAGVQGELRRYGGNLSVSATVAYIW